ncbi:reverse transcriptase domain-containing protein [Citrus sinensis]|uniref:Reverse transcriptase domain-containing protein n=1 Tax=Citrus sinensis TaxID=2711 RepID=A0ACB8M8E2_CITSI|nr:reverse transcriptase domain-containing protein [Citrus sinensis]
MPAWLQGQSLTPHSCCFQQGFDIIDLANDYFLIRFSNAKDVEYALTEGPWTVLGHYLSVQKWTPKFDVDACPDGVDIDPMAKDNPIPLTEVEKQDIVVAGEEPKFRPWMVVAHKSRPPLVNEETISQNHETNSASQSETIVPILESTHNLAQKSRIMKKKPAIQQSKKYPSRKATILNLSTQSMTENINPNTQILNNYSHPHKQPSAMHGMYAIPQLSSMPVLYSTSNAASTSMHGMYANQRFTLNQPGPIPIPITINPLHHSAVSFPKAILAPQANNHLPTQNVCDPSLDGEPPDKVSPRDSSTKETNVALGDSFVASMTEELSSANSSLVVAKSGMENYKPSLVVLLEHHISGYKVDNFIKRIGFDKSYRVEAEGFSGGIWILWKDFLQIKTVASHSQSLLVRSNGLFSRVSNSRPFRFQVAWLTNEGFKDFVAESWNRNLHYLDAANQFRLKTENHSSLKMYRPISLCNIAYKTITKMIANQLHSILPHLVGPHQTSFVPGRHITKNIVIAQEVVHSMRKKTGATGFMAIKVDLEKAYDRFSWEFISDTLREARIPPDLIQVIMACITSVTMRILWNGEATDEFVPSRGIRQGCPLSPYLFVLCIECLSHGIHNAVNVGKWRPIMLSRIGTPLSHLFFADDLLLLTEAIVEQARVISAVLADFYFCSNAKVNTSKTLLYFSKNMGARDMSSISNLLSFSVTSNLGKYLRITLAQSVLQAIPVYIMQTVSFPSIVRERIDRACRRFIWSGASSQQKLSMVSWHNVCKPKAIGGLSFKSLTLMNQSLHMKLAWGIISSPNSLWVRVLTTKYRIDPLNLPHELPTHYGSHLWKSLGHVWSEILASRHWCLGDGLSILFWWDLWVPLIAYATDTIPVEILECKVADFVDLSIPLLMRRAWIPFFGLIRNMAFHAGLKTKAELAKRHLLISTCCDRCGALCEDAMHALRDCPLVDDSRMGDVSNWAVFFGFALWRIGYWRNQFLFNQTMMDYAASLVDVHSRAEETHKLHNSPLVTRNIRANKWISWHPPEWPWCTLNTDGAHKSDGISTTGGLIRDHLRRWIFGFGMMIGSCSITVAELWGLYQGLQLAWNSGIRRLKVETDSLCVTQLVARPSVMTNEYTPLVQAIKDYLKLD